MATVTAAQGSRSELLHKKQSALGTQATGNFTKLRYSTHSLSPQIETIESAEIRADREVQDLRHGNRHGAGAIVAPLCWGDHDTMIESAMFSTFDTDTIIIGTSPQYLSIEDGALDVDIYQMFVDCLVSRMALSIQPNQIVTATFDVVGTDAASPASSTSGGTAVAPSNVQPFDSFTAALFDNAAETGNEIAFITGVEMQIDNGVRPRHVVGQQTPPFLEFGRARVTGTLTMLLTDDVWLERFLAESEPILVINLTDPGGNIYEFRMPRIKLTGGDKPVENEQSRIVTMPFVALRDATLTSALQITRV